MEQEKKFANLFGNNPDISASERLRVVSELEKIGSLTFKIEISEEGWVAQCNEVHGTMAANTNPTPTNAEIEAQIREAIFSAFNIKFDRIKSPFGFEYELPSFSYHGAGRD